VVESLGVGVPEFVALLAVESKTCGFLPDRRPVILFERHWFHKLTAGRFSDAHPDISHPTPGGYAYLAREYPRLEKAMKLDRQAALKSASWGAGQVMGFNHAMVGWPDVESMVADMCASEDLQLKAVAGYLVARKLVAPLQARDWAAVAKGYNGSNYAKNKYDLRLQGEYQKFTTTGLVPDIELRRAQMYLGFLGETLDADGIYGKKSRAAVVKFRESVGLAGGERIDKALLEALRSRVRALR
ncbi:MAG: N-acetylmuramidase family protein, partial [Chitinophagaceae bacterium]|nr:N-acetylmuramidase family protein [Rubrivivax sp.]